MRKLLTVLAAATLAACATQTPYAPADSRGHGFADQRIERDRYRISFRGNSLTTRNEVENALLLRAAEVTLDNGYDHFIVVSDETETETRTSVRDLGPRYGAFGYYGFGPFPYYARGYGWAGYNDFDVRESQRYTAIAYIKLGKGPKPAGEIAAYDARDVQANLSPVVYRGNQ